MFKFSFIEINKCSKLILFLMILFCKRSDLLITKIAFLAFLAYIIGKLISTFKVQYKINPDK